MTKTQALVEKNNTTTTFKQLKTRSSLLQFRISKCKSIAPIITVKNS